ncbi:hypothetical protein ACIQCM_05460 [Pseudarthrobacter sp. NPDC092439]|uniref:hypothetical protein n=1 Tax=unclassified Pseudarthrobacter TaxID=2647000 RepID=UPI0038161EED
MGASNVAKVFAYWCHLDHREARGLAFMANTSMDQHEPPVYFGGWEALAAALGGDPTRNPSNAKRTAMRVLSGLRTAGAIVSSGEARFNVRAEYAITLDPNETYEPTGKGREISWVKVPRPTRVTATDTQQGDSYGHPDKPVADTQQGDSYGPARVTATDTPRSTQEQQEKYKEEKSIGEVPVSPTGDTTTDSTAALESYLDDQDHGWNVQDERNRQSALLLQRQAEYEQSQRKTA